MLTGKRSRKQQNVVISLMVTTTCITIAGTVLLIKNWEYITRYQPHSYIGLFLISVLSNAPLPILTPGIIITFALGSILNPAFVGIVAGLGSTAGNFLAYLIGRNGARFLTFFGDISRSNESNSSWIGKLLQKIKGSRLMDFANRKGVVPVFLLSVFPNPFSTPLFVSLGAARFNIPKFLIACWAGQTIQAVIIAYLGYFGLHSLGIFKVI